MQTEDAGTQIYYKKIDKGILASKAKANSWNRNAGAGQAFDGNDATIWHQKWEDEAGGSSGAHDKEAPTDTHPIWIQTGFGKEKTVGKLVYKAKTNHRVKDGVDASDNRIKKYELYIANLSDTDATPAESDWTRVSSGTVTNDTNSYEIVFTPKPATHIRLTALSGNTHNSHHVAAREIDVYEVCHSSVAINIKKPKAGETGDVRVRDMVTDASVTFTEGLVRNPSFASDEVVDLSEGRDAFSGKYQFLHTTAGNEPLNVTGHKPFAMTFELKIPGGITGSNPYAVIGKRHGQYGIYVKRNGNNSWIEMFANPNGTFSHYRSAYEPGHFADWTRVTALFDGYGFWISLNGGEMTRVNMQGANNNIALQDMNWTHFTIGCKNDRTQVYPGLLSDVKMYVNETALSGGAVQANGAAAAAFAKNLMKPERLVFENGISQELPYEIETKWYKDGAAEAMPEDETFEAGHSYKAEAVLRSKASEDFAFANELYWATVDGQEIEVTDENLSLSENGRELRFEKEFYLWNVSAAAEDAAKGTISLNDRTAAANDSIVADSEQITLAATPVSGYRFLNWTDESGALISRDASVTLDADGNHTYTAHFKAVNSDTMNVARGAVCKLEENTVLGENSDPAKLVDEVKEVNQYVEFSSSAENGVSMVTLDLGSIYSDIDRMVLSRYWDNPDRRYLGTVIAVSETDDFTNSEIVYNSDKGNAFELGKGTEALYQETSAGHEIVLPEGVSGRYVRIYMQGYKEAAGTYSTNHLVEFEVYARGRSLQAGVVTGCEHMGTAEVDKAIVPYGELVLFTGNPNPGFEFEGWYEDASGSEASKIENAQRYHKIQEVTSNRTLYAKFDVKADHVFKVTVSQKQENGSWLVTNEWNGKYNSDKEGETVELGTVELPQDRTFLYWAEKSKPDIVFSAVRDLRFRIPGNLELIPVFSDETNENKTQEGHAEISDTCLIRDEQELNANAKVRFVGKLFIPQDWTLNETGLLWTGKTADIVGELRMNESTELPKENMKKIVATKINLSHQFSATVSNVPSTRTVRGVIYAKMTDPNGTVHWYYSTEESVTNTVVEPAAAGE